MGVLQFSRVPGEYRCTGCRKRLSAPAGERPECPECGLAPLGGVSHREHHAELLAERAAREEAHRLLDTQHQCLRDQHREVEQARAIVENERDRAQGCRRLLWLVLLLSHLAWAILLAWLLYHG